jgi:hypothetical protein
VPYYRAVVPQPPEERAHFLEALQTLGSAEIVVTVKAKSKREAAHDLADSCSTYWGNRVYQDDWFEDRLVALRGEERLAAARVLGV